MDDNSTVRGIMKRSVKFSIFFGKVYRKSSTSQLCSCAQCMLVHHGILSDGIDSQMMLRIIRKSENNNSELEKSNLLRNC